MPFVHKRRIYGFDCDVYGHLNNANYMHLYEEARANVLMEIGYPISKLLEMQIEIYIIDFHLRYIKPVLLEEVISIETTITMMNRLHWTWQQQMKNSANEVCNTAVLSGVFGYKGKPKRIPIKVVDEFMKYIIPK
ncbi:MAG: acyl-CoA thioesterase [Candidatus Cloacimonetes bacterium]|nr:acyl-CoA thioesterase [Candidatus Cloacimonadota bacterium]